MKLKLMLKFKLSIILFVCLFNSYGNSNFNSDSLFEQANLLYEDQNYTEANKGYLELKDKANANFMQSKTRGDIRFHLLVLLALETGARVSDLLNIILRCNIYKRKP